LLVVITVLAALIGLVLSPVLLAVSVRVFEAGILWSRRDFDRPLRLAPDVDDGTVPRWKLPTTMAVSTVMFAATAQAIGLSWVLPAYLWFVAMTIVLSLTDLDRKLIPNRVLYPATLTGLVLLTAGSLADGDLSSLGRGLLGGAAYFVFLYLVYLVARGGFGFGDVKLGLFIGLFAAYLDWGALVISVVGAFIIGAIVSVFLLVLRIKGRKDPIPFGPYMVGAAYIAMLWHEPIRDWYGV
jgi:leader peptidase (prepilin peptidase)/N-methyltransferase